ncbi:hypothetical protein MKX03_018358 [Papaver bracteatum]|nr:hypothetical protein MKX03_018358 [Papaver bracteatum]
MEEEKGMGDMRVKEGYTQDGTVDLKGRLILRSKGGRWKACSFIGMSCLRGWHFSESSRIWWSIYQLDYMKVLLNQQTM